jgi:hypothetical protein
MTPYEAYIKAWDVKRRLPELEPIILKDNYFSYSYARDIVKGRWEEAEAKIATTAYIAYSYATRIIKGRWEKGETAIAKDAYYAYYYAKDVLKWRIKGNEDFYISVIPILWDRFPKRIKSNPDIMTAYFKEAVLQ